MTSAQPQPFNTAQHYLDARGWLCPQPVIAARRWLQRATNGELLHIVITDPHGPLDFEVFCLQTGHKLLLCREQEKAQPNEWHLLIECSHK